MKSKQELTQIARAKWQSSGLDDSHATALQFRVLDAQETALRDASFTRAGALVLPYFDSSGAPTRFYRIRYLEDLPGFAGVVKKPQRYAQPRGTLNEVYLPPLFEFTWADIMADAGCPIYITEGELKAACACAHGLFTMGLGGVDVWRSKKRQLTLLPTLAETEWAGRQVVIIFDSDAASNPNVVRAQRQLAFELTAQGAAVNIASLPAGEGDRKQGLDDFLVTHGTEALADIVKNAPMLPEIAALWGMNEEVVYVRDPGMIIERATGMKMSPGAFKEHVYANRHYTESKPSKQGPPTNVKKPLAPRWLEWEQRFECAGVTYIPGEPRVVRGKWNEWEGWGCEPKAGDVSPWTWLLDFLFDSDETGEGRDWLERWLAYPLQNPGVKMFSSAVLWGIHHGTGKTMVGQTMLEIYGKNGVEIRDKDLEGGFNEWAPNRQFVIGDEVTGNDKRDRADMLKGMITQKHIRINVKYVPSYTLEDRINYLFTSNHPDAFFLEDTDRRFFIHEVVGEPAEFQKYMAYGEWLENGGASALFHHLLELDLEDFNPRAPAPSTLAKTAMILDNKSELGAWCAELSANTEAQLRALGTIAGAECDVFSSNQLLHVFDPEGKTRVTVNGLARELKRAGFRQVNGGVPVRTCVGLQRLYIIRNPEKWESAKPSDVANHWNQYFGPGSKKF